MIYTKNKPITLKTNVFFFKTFANKRNSTLYLHHNNAEVAQLVELQPSKLVVASSSLVFRSKNLDESFKRIIKCGSSSVGRAPAFQAGCREFEPRLPLKN